ncbi:glycosyltransferase family 2 protein [Geomobilimonas luticola]|uniref:Glycosyltransferase n=1 Tax=Geomobilimonas luticola TaxID=1114878 RepID=A0ABS5SC40_9BACT|nr:glycosyltransferase [Geomobilimonas luticola]MBT0652927.1 glycosyltransferase [Geomobilimonas luticola]
MSNKFSVIIATYNCEEYLRQAIESVLAQTFTDYEFIVVDDGSTDGTQGIIQSYGPRIKYIRQENQGSEMAYKTGVSHASGEYMAFLDSDDLFLPNALATYDKIIRQLESPPLIIGAMQRFFQNEDVDMDSGCVNDDAEVFIYRDYLSKDVGIGLSQSRILMHKTLFDQVYGLLKRSKPCYLNDYDLLLQAGIYGPCIIVKSPVTVAYRQHEKQGSRQIEKMSQGVLYLLHSVWQGKCSGGRSRFFDKCAYLGGPVYEWSSKAFKIKRPGLAFKIIINGWLMLLAAVLKKIAIMFRCPAKALIIT